MMVSKLVGNISKKIPGSYLNLLETPFSNCKTILDVGCGDGSFFKLIKNPHWECEGIDAYKPAIEIAKKSGIYQKVYYGDVLKISKTLVIKKKKYDGIFCSQLIEHISKKEGQELVSIFEKIAKKVIVIATPNEFMDQPHGYGEIGNKYQEHKSGWSVKDFRNKGYYIKGTGLKILWSQKGPARSKMLMIRALSRIISIICMPITVEFPSLASGLVAIKKYEK